MPPYLFTREQRLLKAADFGALFKGRDTQRSSDNLLTVLARPNGGILPRLGFAVGRKAVPTAVARNRIKRQGREYFRIGQYALPALDVLIMARAGAARADKTELRASLHRHLTRLSQRCAGSCSAPSASTVM